MPAPNRLERAEYLDLAGERVYAVTYGCRTPTVRVLLCGPFPSDRLFSLAAWVKWARFLAQHNVLAIRFDYRGTGESTGKFAEMDFEQWVADIVAMCSHTGAQDSKAPLLLHGMGMGALLAQKAFALGKGDALLMWAAPAEGREVLRYGLMARVSIDLLMKNPSQRKTAQEYIAQLRAGIELEVDGHTWSPALWRSAEQMNLDAKYAQAGEGVDETSRPWKHVRLGDHMAPLVRSARVLRAMNPRAAVVPETPLNPDFGEFFNTNLNWLLGSLSIPGAYVQA